MLAALLSVLAVGLAGAWWSVRLSELPDVAMAASDGRPFTWERLAGRWGLVYFGYRGCPTACPTALSDLAREVRALGNRGDRVQVVMVTVDPDRDATRQLASYVAYFHPAFLGVRIADPDDLQAVCKAFGAAFAPAAEGGGEIEHSLDVFLIDPRGRLRGHLSPPFVRGELARALGG